MIERRIVRVERFVHLAEEASNLACAPVSYGRVAEERYLTRYPRPKPLILGIFLFPLASSLVFTSIPVFLSIKIGASSSLIFYILFIRSITTLVGYTLIRIHKQRKLLKTIKTASILGILFPILILLSAFLPSHLSLTLSSLALAIAGFAGPKFSTAGTVLWTKCAPKGTAGTYRAGLTFGTALGSLLGGFIPSYYGFNALFTVSAIISAMCLFFFSLTTRKRW